MLDWDGTVTERDTLDLVLQEFGDPEVYERVEAELDAGRMTLNDVISAEFATVTAPLDEVVSWLLEHARVRPGFAELARARPPADRLVRLPRADRAGARARGGPG